MKRYMLFAAACCSAALVAADVDAMRENAKNRRREVIYDNDSDDHLEVSGTPSIRKYYDARTSYLADYPVDTVVYTVNYGGFTQLHIPSKNGDELEFRSDLDPYRRKSIGPLLKSQGSDVLKLQIAFARKHGKEIFAGLRMNDTHDSVHRPEKPFPFFPKFKKEHPEMLFAQSWTASPGYGAWSCYDYTHREVREKLAAIAGEIALNYDVDGISLDFFRVPSLFLSVAKGGSASQAEVDSITAMLKEIRKYLDEAGRRRGRHILLAVRTPDSAEYCRRIGIDLETLFREKTVDIWFPAGGFHLQPWKESVELARRYGVKCYPSVDRAYFASDGLIRYPWSRQTPPAYFARAAAAFAAGADGIYYFNLYQRHWVRDFMRPKDALKTLDKRYFVSDRSLMDPEDYLRGGGKLRKMTELTPKRPVTISGGKEVVLPLEFGDDIAELRRGGAKFRVTAALRERGGASGKIAVSSNGVSWRVSGTDGCYTIFDVPDGALLPGVNQLTLGNTGDEVEDMYTILAGDRILSGAEQRPWRRLFGGNPSGTPEKIVDGAYQIEDNGPGRSNLIYPMKGVPPVLKIEFECSVLSNTSRTATCMRVANGDFVEIVSFNPGAIWFINADKKLPFRADRWHKYRIEMGEGKISLFADGKFLMDAPLSASPADRQHRMPLPSKYREFNDRSILIGSMTHGGSGISRWKDLRISRIGGIVEVEDLAVEVVFDRPPPRMRQIDKWSFQGSGRMLSVGKMDKKDRDLTAELPLRVTSGAVTVIAANGGSVIAMKITPERLSFPDGNGRSASLPRDEKHCFRFEMGDGILRVFRNGKFAAEAPTDSATGKISRTPSLKNLPPDEYSIARHGGILIIPDDDAVWDSGTMRAECKF